VWQARASKNPIFLKTQNKHLYWLYSSEILDIKALEYNKYLSEEFTSYSRYCGNKIPNVWSSGE
jgi:hypothetical protein